MAVVTRRGTRAPARAWLLRIAGTLLFFALLVWLDLRGALHLEDVWSSLSRANLWLVGLSILFYVPFVTVKAARWRLVSADMLMPLSLGDAWRIYAIGLAAGTFTPGQAGDALKAFYQQQKGYPLGRALGSSVLDRLFDVAVLAALGLLGVAVYGGKFAGQTPVLVLWVLACLAVVLFLAWERTRDWLFGMVRSRLARMGMGSRGTGVESGQQWSLQPRTLAYAGLLTLASFTISIFRVWLMAAALGTLLGPLQISGFVGLTTAAALVPVTVGGVGTRDVLAAVAFQQIGHTAAEGIAVSALILVLNLAQALTGWLIWLRYRASD